MTLGGDTMRPMRSLASAAAVVVVMVLIPALASAQTTDDEDDTQSTVKVDGKAKVGGKVKAGGKAKAKGGKDDKDAKDAKAKAKAKADEKAGAAAAKGDTTGFEAGAEVGAGGETEDSASTGFTSTGEEENPNAPRVGNDTDEQPVATTAKVMPEQHGPYPIQYVMRPNLLPKRMTEVTLDLPNKFNKYMQSFVLGAHHGVTDKIEVGLRYNIGTFTEGGDGVDNKFYGGKAVAIDFEYGIFSWLSGQLSIPMLFDPFSSAATLGAPMKFSLFEKLSIELGRDVFTFRLNRIIPSAENAAINEALVAADETGTDTPAAYFNLQAAFTFQNKENTAIQARVGQSTSVDSDETTERNPLLFDLGYYYSTSNRIDFGGRLGWFDINDASETFGVYLFAAARF